MGAPSRSRRPGSASSTSSSAEVAPVAAAPGRCLPGRGGLEVPGGAGARPGSRTSPRPCGHPAAVVGKPLRGNRTVGPGVVKGVGEDRSWARAGSSSSSRHAGNGCCAWPGCSPATPHLAEDLLQTVLAKVWPKWHRIAEENPEAYVRRALVHTHASWWRRRWRGEVRDGDLPDRALAQDAVCRGGPGAGARRGGARPAGTPAGRRGAAVLRGPSVTETAEALGCSEGTVKSQAAKALRTLRRLPPLPAAVTADRRLTPWLTPRRRRGRVAGAAGAGGAAAARARAAAGAGARRTAAAPRRRTAAVTASAVLAVAAGWWRCPGWQPESGGSVAAVVATSGPAGGKATPSAPGPVARPRRLRAAGYGPAGMDGLRLRPPRAGSCCRTRTPRASSCPRRRSCCQRAAARTPWTASAPRWPGRWRRAGRW